MNAAKTKSVFAPALWAGLLACGLLFLLAPEVDLAFSSLFYRPGEGFWLRHHGLLEFVHAAIEWLSWAVPAVLLGLLLLSWPPLSALAARVTGAGSLGQRLARWRRPAAFLLLLLALGPGLLVNGVLKEHVERARPHQIAEFGGERLFTPPFLPTRECSSNCSFVSGHAAFGFYLLGAAFIAAPGARRRWLLAGLASGAIVGLMRILQGGHFLSDVVFAGFAVYMVAALTHRLLFSPTAEAVPPGPLQASRRRESASP